MADPHALPSYEQTQGSADPVPSNVVVYDANQAAIDEPPPSYDSLFGKLKQANQESTGTVDAAAKSVGVLKKSCSVCFVALGCMCLVCLGFAIPVAEITIGGLYLSDCPANYLIPVYLVVAGVFEFISAVSCGGSCAKKKEDTDDGAGEESGCKKLWNRLNNAISLFLFCWSVAGIYWIVSTYPIYTPIKPPNQNVTNFNPLYCNGLVMKFSYGVIIGKFALAGLFVFISLLTCIVLVCIKCSAKDAD